MFSSVANAEISCEDAGGKLFKGNDGKTEYCISFHGMNWWSANAWCQALGLELVDLQTECEKRGASIVATSACHQLQRGDLPSEAWAKNTSSSSRALYIYLQGGGIFAGYKDALLNALCLIK